MKIWIDFINTPQVSFWVPFIRNFKENGEIILLTCRDSGNTVELLKQNEFDFTVIGQKAGKGILEKALFFPKRLVALYSFIRKNKPDIAVSQSSFYQPAVARFLKIPCLYTNDNEHARGNIFGFLFAQQVLLPIALCKEKFTKKWPLRTKLTFYPSVKEAIYLSQEPGFMELISKPKNTIYFRPEPWSAQYYKGPLNFFDETLIKLSEENHVIILPRDKNQKEHYKQSKFNRITVAEKPISLKTIVAGCKLFIGAGGSMTRELAVLNIPVISIYQSDLLCVDKYLVEKGYMKVNPELTYQDLQLELSSETGKKSDFVVLEEGIKSYELIYKKIIKNDKRSDYRAGKNGIIPCSHCRSAS